MSATGKYIVLEGIDGSGKSFQSRKLAESLPNVILTAEPTKYSIGTLIREKIRAYGLSNPTAEEEREALLFFADRIDHHDMKIKPKLKEGKTVISDRCYHSTLAYQGALGGDMDFIIGLRNRYIEKGILLQPDLTIIIDLPVEEAIKRMGDKKKEKFETHERLEKVRQIYLHMPEHFPTENIVIIDGNASEEVVYSKILEAIA